MAKVFTGHNVSPPNNGPKFMLFRFSEINICEFY